MLKISFSFSLLLLCFLSSPSSYQWRWCTSHRLQCPPVTLKSSFEECSTVPPLRVSVELDMRYDSIALSRRNQSYIEMMLRAVTPHLGWEVLCQQFILQSHIVMFFFFLILKTTRGLVWSSFVIRTFANDIHTAHWPYSTWPRIVPISVRLLVTPVATLPTTRSIC